MNDSLGDRMKEYESVSRTHLVRRMPVILRLDGRAFHTFTKGFDKPYDKDMFRMMTHTCMNLFNEVQTSVFIYSQSDEISILLRDYDKLETQPWFGGNVQKITSVSASIATVSFNKERLKLASQSWTPASAKKCEEAGWATFDARVFNIPKEDVVNYFIWRQNDATRNSINSLGQTHFSHKELQNKSTSEVQDMLFKEKGINWDKIETQFKRGFCIYKRTTYSAFGAPFLEGIEVLGADMNIPIFTQDRQFISRFLEPEV